jgi:hypothetical protein
MVMNKRIINIKDTAIAALSPVIKMRTNELNAKKE